MAAIYWCSKPVLWEFNFFLMWVHAIFCSKKFALMLATWVRTLYILTLLSPVVVWFPGSELQEPNEIRDFTRKPTLCNKDSWDITFYYLKRSITFYDIKICSHYLVINSLKGLRYLLKQKSVFLKDGPEGGVQILFPSPNKPAVSTLKVYLKLHWTAKCAWRGFLIATLEENHSYLSQVDNVSLLSPKRLKKGAV